MCKKELKMFLGLVLVSVDIPKFKWCFTGTEIKDTTAFDRVSPKDLVVKDLPLSMTKPTKWKSIKECVFRVKTVSANSKLGTLNLKQGSIVYYHNSMYDSLKDCFGDNDEIEVLLFQTYFMCNGYSISATKSTGLLKTLCGSILPVGNISEQTVEFSGYSFGLQSKDKDDESFETYIEHSYFTRQYVSRTNDGRYIFGKEILPRNYEFFVLFVDQIQSEDHGLKFMVGEGRITIFDSDQDFSNRVVERKYQLMPSKPLISMSYDYIAGAKFFEL
ncbi:hypothetical protein [Borrelia crocidurae]|uniref:Uncharacterized protein n=1 Tax=Borrelia crocidurae (strain Achema) TaxID=1155096 RepID=I0FEK2_BORCA|nr:hypothetical protein [Borrelia crocidurae]AFI31908.1 hypothetical protein Q7M_1452 [Borrelia crocidurae str. Achema]